MKLEQNYRSTQTILDAANARDRQQPRADGKHLWTDVGEGDPVRVREMADEHAEARFVTAEIERLVDEGVSRAEIAVFYRTNAQSRVMEDMLVRAQIAYQVIGGTKFYERAEIKDAVNYLHVPGQPAGRDGVHADRELAAARARADVDVARALATPRRRGSRCGRRASSRHPRPGDRGATVARALHVDDGAPARARRERRAGRAGARRRCSRRPATRRRSRPSGRSRPRAGSRTSRSSCASTQEYDATAPEGGSVGEFLQQIALLADADGIRDDEGLVTLMTLHNAKGLEFPIVFIIGMEDGTFPHSRSIEEGNIDEERRLAYVGLTRAMRDLTLTYARRRGAFGGSAGGPTIRSRFLDEIPRELTDQTARDAARASPHRAGSPRGRAPRPRPPRPRPTAAARPFRVGEDIVHAKLGDGVVTGVEPGGIVVVRFAGDGSERKLMADYAPIRRR